jgi:hypothetical protein
VTPEQFCYWLKGWLVGTANVDSDVRANWLTEVEDKLQAVLERKELEQTTEVWTTKAHRDHAEILKEYVK